jgi:hypothetical protein
MADYRDLAAALGGGYGQDTGGITPDTLATLRNGKKASAADLLGMLKAIGSGSLSNLESLGRGGLSQFLGAPVDTANTVRTPYPMEVFGDVNYAPDKQLPGGSADILGMMPRVTKPTAQTAGMEIMGGFMAPATAKALKPAVVATGRMIGKEINAGLTGQPTRSLLGDITPKPLMAVEPQMQMAQAVTKPKAEVSPLGFYSAVEQQALNIPRKQGTGASFLNELAKGQDVKKYEMETMGLDEFLKNKPNVTRQEVQDYIANNRINVQERQLGQNIAEDPIGIAQRKTVFDKYEPEIQGLYNEMQQYETNIINSRNLASKNYAEAHAALNKPGNPQPTPTPQDWDNYYAAKKELERVNQIPLDSREFARKLNTLRDARDAEANAAYTIPESEPTKYEKYQLPGGENYREILMTLPNKPMDASKAAENYYTQFVKRGGEPDWGQLNPAKQQEIMNSMPAQAKNASAAPEYRSSHWDEPNVLAHMRVNDRVDADGKKMLLIEEIQSDWHQAGREKGYKNPQADKALEIEAKAILDERKNLVAELVEQETKNGFVSTEGQLRWDKFKEKEDAYKQKSKDFSNQVPDAPFKETWYQLALKRALKEAVDKGYDRIGLTTGAQQAERYNLAKQVDEVIAKRNPDGSFNLDAILVNGGKQEAIGKNIPANKLSEYVGNDLAKSMQAQEAGTDVYSGDALKVGGEGMKKYYDEIYPAFLNKQGKKYGAQVGETNVKTQTSAPAFVDYIVGPGNFNDTTVLGLRSDGTTAIVNQNANSMEEAQQLANRYKEKHLGGGQEKVRYLDITPEMRKAIKEGQPLASIQDELAKALA